MNYVNQAQIPKASIMKRPLRSASVKEPPSRLELIMKQSCMEVRDKIKRFGELSECNIILFGPSGSGKSSLIATFNQSLNQGSLELPDLCIKSLLHNEGTQQYQLFTLREGSLTQIQSRRNSLSIRTCKINVIDTRGQILLNQRENMQLQLMLEGRVKNMSQVQQRNYRYAYLLWEFWKQDTELFPQQILIPNQQSIPNQVVLVFDGSLDQVPNGPEEIEFYRQVIQLARMKGFATPLIVLTRLDKLENRYQDIAVQKEKINQRIQSIVHNLGVERKHVHFLENYHGQKQSNQVDYYSLQLLLSCLVQPPTIQAHDCQLF